MPQIRVRPADSLGSRQVQSTGARAYSVKEKVAEIAAAELEGDFAPDFSACVSYTYETCLGESP